MINEVLNEFTENDVDPTLIEMFDPERKKITFTQ